MLWADYCQWDEAARLRSFPLFLGKDTLNHLHAAFNNKFGGEENRRILEAQRMETNQKKEAEERQEQYVEKMGKLEKGMKKVTITQSS